MGCTRQRAQETMYRLKAYGVKSTILFFGSARAKSREQYDGRMEELTKQVRLSGRQWEWVGHDREHHVGLGPSG